MPKAEILKIERIQNKILWRKFITENESISDKYNGQSPTCKSLYFDSKNCLEHIYNSEEGFDVRFNE